MSKKCAKATLLKLTAVSAFFIGWSCVGTASPLRRPLDKGGNGRIGSETGNGSCALRDPLCLAAKRSLEENIIKRVDRESGTESTYLRAGANQFGSLWTRDFCFSVPGLLKLHHEEVVHDQIELILKNTTSNLSSNDTRHPPFLAPRALDSIPPQLRVALVVASESDPEILEALKKSPFFGEFIVDFEKGPSARLRPEYIGENKTAPIDSNALVVLASAEYAIFLEKQNPGAGKAWARGHQSQFRELLRYYDNFHDEVADSFGNPSPSVAALVWQSGYSDWQDSVRREGFTLMTNVLYYLAVEKMQNFVPLVQPEWFASLRSQIENTFKDPRTKLYFSVRPSSRSERQVPYDQISSDAILFGLDQGFWEGSRAAEVYTAYLKSALVQKGVPYHGHPLPGFVTTPNYPALWVSWTARGIGLEHYHDQYYWTWLMGLGIKVAHRFADEVNAENLYAALSETSERDQNTVGESEVGELFIDRPDLPLWSTELADQLKQEVPYGVQKTSLRSPLRLRAEKPFSWGSAMIVDALVP